MRNAISQIVSALAGTDNLCLYEIRYDGDIVTFDCTAANNNSPPTGKPEADDVDQWFKDNCRPDDGRDLPP